jgi:hypothetical protein
MNDIEEAYRILVLERGASMKEVREAHRDLCLVWDSSRFKDNPQMQKKAHDQLGRIDEAFETLRIDHGGAPKIKGETGQEPPSEKDRAQPPDQTESSEEGAPSLYEEIFRGEQDQTQRRIPIGWIIAVVMVLVVAVIYLGGPADGDEVEASPSAPALEGPHEMEGPIQNAASGPGDLTSRQPQPDGPSGPASSPVQTTSDPIQSAGSSSEPPTDPPVKAETDSQPLSPSSSAVDAGEPVVPVVGPREPEPNNRPVLERDTLSSTDQTEEPSAQEAQQDEGSEEAFEILKEKSVIARRLIEGEGVPDLSYQEWKTVRGNAPEFWIDVITRRTTDGGELHLIWSVNTDTGVVQPLSQAARDAETGPLPD